MEIKKIYLVLMLFSILTWIIIIRLAVLDRQYKLEGQAIVVLSDRITYLEEQVQDLQDNCVSFDALQPVLTDFEDYQLEVDEIRNNLNDYNSLWQQLFGYEQKQYILRGR